MRALAFSFVLPALAVACGHDEPLQASVQPDAAVDAASDAEPSPEAGPRVRTVELRNPFGNTALEDNLLVDGDFELTSSSGQFGWRAISGTGEAALIRETGGLCRSGVTCGVVTPGTDLLAMATAPAGQSMQVEIWTKPPASDCSLTAVSVIGCTGVVPTTIGSVPPETFEPDASGWCRHRGVTPATALRPCLIVSSFAEDGQRTLIDAGSLRAAATAAPSSMLAGPPSAELFSRAERALRVIRQTTRFGRPAPTRP